MANGDLKKHPLTIASVITLAVLAGILLAVARYIDDKATAAQSAALERLEDHARASDREHARLERSIEAASEEQRAIRERVEATHTDVQVLVNEVRAMRRENRR